jgi:hypothetical protein
MRPVTKQRNRWIFLMKLLLHKKKQIINRGDEI